MQDPESQERRKIPRIKIRAPVRYQIKSSKSYGAALTSDFSQEGLRFTCDEYVSPQTEFVLEVFLAELTRNIHANGRVVWSQRLPHSNRYQLGIKFTEIENEDKKCISEYASAHQYLL